MYQAFNVSAIKSMLDRFSMTSGLQSEVLIGHGVVVVKFYGKPDEDTKWATDVRKELGNFITQLRIKYDREL